MSHVVADTERRDGGVVPRSAGLAGQVAVSWTAAGCVVVGGFLVAAMTLTGRLSGNGVLVTSGALFLIGALLGFVHGGVLGLLGRPAGVTGREALRGLALGGLYAVPASLVSAIVAGWIAMAVVARFTGRVGPMVGVGLAALVGLALVLVAGELSVQALRNAYARWPEWRTGTVIVSGSFGALLIAFLSDRPMIWGFELRVTSVGAVLLAALIAIWCVGPLVTLALRLRGRVRPPVSDAAEGAGHGAAGVVVGLVVGVVLGLIALPFTTGYAVPTPVPASDVAGSVVLAVSRAIVDEVLLRLVLVTGVAWLLLRWGRLGRGEAAVVAVAAAALVQVTLYLPAVWAIGFPSPLVAIGYVVAAILIPAVAFGALFWARGLSAALAAHAAALIALALVLR